MYSSVKKLQSGRSTGSLSHWFFEMSCVDQHSVDGPLPQPMVTSLWIISESARHILMTTATIFEPNSMWVVCATQW